MTEIREDMTAEEIQMTHFTGLIAKAMNASAVVVLIKRDDPDQPDASFAHGNIDECISIVGRGLASFVAARVGAVDGNADAYKDLLAAVCDGIKEIPAHEDAPSVRDLETGDKISLDALRASAKAEEENAREAAEERMQMMQRFNLTSDLLQRDVDCGDVTRDDADYLVGVITGLAFTATLGSPQLGYSERARTLVRVRDITMKQFIGRTKRLEQATAELNVGTPEA